MYYEEVFRELNKREVDYLVVGGVALVLHDVVRLTVDLDLMLDMSEKNLLKFIATMKALGYKPKIPVKAEDFANSRVRKRWVKEKNMKVFSFYNPKKSFMIVDVMLENVIDFDEAKKERSVVKADRLEIPVVSVKHLKKLKRISGREQDLEDIKALQELARIKNEKKRR